jgi:hypothetical protein
MPHGCQDSNADSPSLFRAVGASRWTEVLAEFTTHFAEHVCVTRLSIGWCRWLGKAVFAATRRGFIAGRRGEAARPVIATKATCTTQWCGWFSGSVPGMPRSRRSPAIHPGGSAASGGGSVGSRSERPAGTAGPPRAAPPPRPSGFPSAQSPIPSPFHTNHTPNTILRFLLRKWLALSILKVRAHGGRERHGPFEIA